jgi:hypothetical protein
MLDNNDGFLLVYAGVQRREREAALVRELKQRRYEAARRRDKRARRDAPAFSDITHARWTLGQS